MKAEVVGCRKQSENIVIVNRIFRRERELKGASDEVTG